MKTWPMLSMATGAAVLLGAPHAAAQEAPETFHACYVPQVGAMYLIQLDGLPETCVSENHEEISWTEGDDRDLEDQSVTTEKLADGAVSEEKLDAEVAGAFSRAARFDTGSSTQLLDGNVSETFGSGAQLMAPRDGFAVVVGSVSFFTTLEEGCIGTSCAGQLHVRHAETGARTPQAQQSVIAPNEDDWTRGSAAVSWIFPVQEGQNTFELRVRRTAGSGTIRATNGMLSAIFVPFGAEGGTTL